ncbi:class I SAM-dependent methyltransferase [Ramlibacter sp.]|uniref:class I SAM-dependent methyltransferase n=1 Tax=Ramlibacter sp. TaxID=1917967 RepID=UPI0018203902|nr:class I SAM-dependent methyltransferase [Ramlibacter sp.]MBA2676331.1 class I SAM-dependent methyltransferase [Ramlibacter sp.]
MSGTLDDDSPQARMWNGLAGQAWVDTQDLLDGLFQPMEDLLAQAVAARAPRSVLDVGCGAGATTLAAARLLGAQGHCTGIDISEPLIAAARARALRDGTPATFLRADAQRHAFAADGFDMVVSRFGVMFFDDPVQAFANLRHAAAAGADLRCLAWRSPEDNPFMTAAERAAAPFLPDMPARRPDAPGQFAFANARRVRGILQDSGWNEIDIRPIDIACTFPAKDLVRYVTRLGPLGQMLHTLDAQTRAQVTDTVRAAFDAYVHAEEVRLIAACWVIKARKGQA